MRMCIFFFREVVSDCLLCQSYVLSLTIISVCSEICFNGASTRNLAEGKHIHALGWLIDFSIWDENLQNVKTLPNFRMLQMLRCFQKSQYCSAF